MRRLALALSPLLLALETPAYAQAPSWRVSEASGDVRITESGRSRAATRGALLSSGSIIATAARARAVLVRGQEYVVVSPNSRLRIPDATQAGSRGVIQMLTDWGTALFRIERRATAHFGVQTPYLAAVVKGTVFTVTVSQSGASVQVTEGAVEVSTMDGGAAEMVRPGMVAMVAASDLLQLNIEAETSRSIRSNGVPAAGVVTVPAPEAGRYEGPVDAPSAVSTTATEGDVSLGDVTDGLVAGRGGTELAVADVRDLGRDNRGSDNSSPGVSNGSDAGGGEGNAAGGSGAGAEAPGNPGNPGNGGGSGNSGPGSGDGDDAGNPGNGGGNDNSGPGNNNGGGNDNSGPGNNNGGGNDNSGPGNNNGGGNDGDGDDAGNPGNGGGNDNSGPGNNNGGGNGDDDDDNSGPGNNNGGGNDDDDDDDNSGPGNNNGGGNDDDDDDVSICLPGDLLCLGLRVGDDDDD